MKTIGLKGLAKMNNIIVDYQKVYHHVTQKLKKTESILGAFVFGSMVTGDLWENSDIDFFIIQKGKKPGIQNIYSVEEGIPVHLKLMSKNELMTMKGLEIKGSYFHRIFSSSKLVFSKDEEITEKYNNLRFYPEMERRKWTLSYLGKLIKSIDSTEKFMHYGNHYGAYNTLLESMELYASIYVNSRGYLISKDTINMAAGLNPEYEEEYQYLVSSDDLAKKIIKVNKYLKQTLDQEILEASEVLLAYFREKSSPMSSSELLNDAFFSDFDIHMEGILNLLYSKNLLKRSLREVYSDKGEELVKENVYQI